ncbi:MAG: IS110 family transposase [Candidatus Thorarchaeota archaeon]
MNQTKYIGMDVHVSMTVIAIMNSDGKVVTEAIIETKAPAIKDFFRGQRGTLHVTFEEGCQAAWLYDLIRPYVAEVIVCNPKKIARSDRRSDRIDAKRLAELLRTDAITPTYHGEHSTQNLKELARCYIAIVHDSTRVKNRLKAVFRGRGIDCSGTSVYSKEDREDWRRKIDNAARLSRADRLWKQLDYLTELAEEAEKELLKEARKHASIKILRSAPGIGPLRAAIILAIAVTPHRFRTIKQFWAYCGLAVRSKITGEYEMMEGQIRRRKKQPLIRGLNRNYSRTLKNVFKGAAASVSQGPWKNQYDAKVKAGTKSSLVLLTMARKISASTYSIWKKGERYDDKILKFTHAG